MKRIEEVDGGLEKGKLLRWGGIPRWGGPITSSANDIYRSQGSIFER